jgi:hypothetical protein
MTNAKCRRIIRQAMSAYLAFVMVVCMQGCSGRYGRVMETKTNHNEISKAHSEFSRMANSSDLPLKYVNEGKIGVTKVEAALETANTDDVNARAEMNKQVADLNARRTEINAEVNKDLSLAEAFRKKHLKEYTKAMAQIKARETELEALTGNKDTIVASLKKEAQTAGNDIISNGHEKLQSEMARIDQIREIHKAIEVEGSAKILEMVEASKATRERADATVNELKAKAQAVKLEKQARVDELNEQIKSTQIQTNSEANRVKVAREALLKDTAAHVEELRTKAQTIKANLASEEFQLKLAQAESTKAGETARTKEKSENAPTRLEKALAEIATLRAEIQHHQDSSAANYESMVAEIQAKLDDEINEIKKRRVNADRIEQVARAEFVKAEAAARAEAVRQTAIHKEALAEAEKLQIVAEAEQEAARLKQEMLEEMAAKKEANRVDIDGNTTEPTQQPADLHTVPVASEVTPVAPRIEPDHIAAFRKAFAEVMEIRAQADAHQMVADATFAEAKTNILAVKTQEDAIAAEKLAVADALEAQAHTRFKEIETKLAKEMDIVESTYQRQLVEADSFRREKEAEAMDLVSQANAMDEIANARAEQLMAEEDSIRKCGQNDIEELKVALWAVQQRSDAEYAKLMTEAQSVSESQEALAMQLDAQVDAARRTLVAKLDQLASSIESQERIAQADYQQALAQAEVLTKKSEAEINRIEAQFKMEQAVARTQIDCDRKLSLSQNQRARAAYDRMVANAMSSRASGNANIDSQVAAAEADMNIILANNSAKRDAAQAQLDAVKARFTARVEQVKAERTIARANEDNAMLLKQTDLATALAEARTAREDSRQKLAILQKRQAELQTASIEDWSNKLAMFKTPEPEKVDIMDNAKPSLETTKEVVVTDL